MYLIQKVSLILKKFSENSVFIPICFVLFCLIFQEKSYATIIDTDLFSTIAEKVMVSVVNLSSSTVMERPSLSPFPFQEYLYGNPKSTVKVFSLGSGIVIDSIGTIVTNNHVLGSESEVKIQFTESLDEKPTPGKVIGRDPDLDLALIQSTVPLKCIPVKFGNSDLLKVGEFVLAVGNPFGQGHSVSHGILSAKGRVFPDGPYVGFLQTDAPINPGNSGGPLVNMNGEVIGINTAIQINAQGIGYAIPINAIKEILPELKAKGKIDRPYLGIMVEHLSESVAALLGVSKSLTGSVVTTVYEGSPAEGAGVKPYDVIIAMNGKETKNPFDLIKIMSTFKVGDQLELLIIRSGKEKKINVKLSGRPDIESEKLQNQEISSVFIHSKSGMRLEKVPDEQGILITGTIIGGLAERAGLSTGDLILDFDRKKIGSLEQLKRALNASGKHLLRVLKTRMGKEIFTIVEIDLG